MPSPHSSAPQAKASRKQTQIVEQIAIMAREYGAGMKLPTIVELSKMFGVTVSTIDRSLGRLEEMGLIRRKRGSGIYVSSRIDQKRIGLVFGRNIFGAGSSPFYRLLMQACEQRALRHNEAFSFYLNTPLLGRDEDDYIHQDLEDALSSGRLDGIIAANIRNPKQDRLLRSYGVPMVVLSQSTSGYGLIDLDMEDFMEQSFRAMEARGARSVGLLGTLPLHQEVFERVARAKGVVINPDWVQCLPGPDFVSPDRYEAEGRAMMLSLYEKNAGRLPEALIIKDDMLARGVCAEMEHLGAAVGKDVKIVSQSNKGSDTLYDWANRLNLIEYDSQEIVEVMFSELEALMEEPDEPRPPAIVRGHLK
ncbi:GntR family transcriptional regulator [Coraliomargarita algicola]|uniref:GntR family transcriptional regulator n=1 Tax=Coraliomargarita algicola TaxID=3092156 RepID=A0ABZ0RMP2_9BACT|nr:GntR family transcriptional regulator [Coraliomargarita sp. J2-16]WPJ96777.1 GntR family transcriptional regulator [Coraliomargarita sp. J2-16]